MTLKYPFSHTAAVLLMGLLLAMADSAVWAKPKPITIKSAMWNHKKQALQVTATANNLTGTLSLLHGDGGLLDEQLISGKKQTFSIPLARLGQVPCTIEARVGDQTSRKPVKGAPLACRKVPVCQILQPVEGAQIVANQPFEFGGRVRLRDKSAPDLTYTWDFAGGAMGVDSSAVVPNTSVPPTGLNGTTRFVIDNNVYRIRFSATDSQKRRCEAAVTVKVGTPPADDSNLPAKVTELPVAGKSMPLRGSETNGDKNDLVVLPFEDWSMQHQSDARALINGVVTFPFKESNLRAHVIKKGSVGGSKPTFVSDADVKLQYSASSNPFDPVGADSINSTSQNWPLNADIDVAAPLATAKVKKSDWWEAWSGRPDEEKPDYYASKSLFVKTGLGKDNFPDTGIPPGFRQDFLGSIYLGMDEVPYGYPDWGAEMPGRSAPYQANEPKDFFRYDASNQWFEANEIPITDIDDQGKVNPFPLMRVAVLDKTGGLPRAATDAVLSNSKDFQCRECHAKGQIAGLEGVRSAQACGYTPWDGYPDGNPYGPDLPSQFCNNDPATGQPRADVQFFEPMDITGQASHDLFDIEAAATRNMGLIHSFYDSFLYYGLQYYRTDLGSGGFPLSIATWDNPDICGTACHHSRREGSQAPVVPGAGIRPSGWEDYRRNNDQTGKEMEHSYTMHRFHAQLQYNADKSDILRFNGEANQKHFPDGAPKRWDFANGPNNSTTSGSLFPIFDDQGRQLPMEQNCLRCHAGHREPLYRDRMLTAQRTCYDCHGDMAAMGQAFKKPEGLSQGATTRTSWADQPDCAACHTGDGNEGADQKNGFYSAGVKQRAFDTQVANPKTGQLEDNLAATPRRPDPADPESVRFAVVQTELNQAPHTKGATVYRFGKDQHGYVGCPACHGAAHAIGPNRDPKANDNVTAIELQGYPGQIFECNVCHTHDAFNTEDSIGSTLHYPGKDGTPGILAGPHNLHPVNDVNWWKQRSGGAENQDGSFYGGWHTVWSGKPGLNNEDQCAACHGADHRGTRLSQTPVDRVFDFSKLDFKKLKKAGFKTKIVKVKAGTAIGCDTCHSLDTSRRHTPTGPVTQRSSPVILPPETEEFVLANGDQPFSYQVPVHNPDNDPLSFEILTSVNSGPNTHYVDIHGYSPNVLNSINGLSIDQKGLISWKQPNTLDPLAFRVRVTDGTGGVADRWYWMNLQACASGKQPVEVGGYRRCTEITFTDPSPELLAETGAFFGVPIGEAFKLPVQAATPDSRALTYSLEQAFGPKTFLPEGLAIDPASGLLTWTPNKGGLYHLSAIARDAQSEMNALNFYLQVCTPPYQNEPYAICHAPCPDSTPLWNAPLGECTTLKITSAQYPGVNSGETFHYQTITEPAATHYQLTDIYSDQDPQADGLSINESTGAIDWRVPAETANFTTVNFRITASNDAGMRAGIDVQLTVCKLPAHWDGGGCSE